MTRFCAASSRQRGGYVFKTVGDSFRAAFPTASVALSAALDSQQALAARSWAAAPALRVRMALHTGAAEERDGDYFGPPLNRVARLLAAGHGGQTLLSTATHELVRDALPPGATAGTWASTACATWAGRSRSSSSAIPACPATSRRCAALDPPALPGNLPQQLTSFIGREREMAAVKALLAKTPAGDADRQRRLRQDAAGAAGGGGVLDGDYPDGIVAGGAGRRCPTPRSSPQAVAAPLGVAGAGRAAADADTDRGPAGENACCWCWTTASTCWPPAPAWPTPCCAPAPR